jgi:hypothetical protein
MALDSFEKYFINKFANNTSVFSQIVVLKYCTTDHRPLAVQLVAS